MKTSSNIHDQRFDIRNPFGTPMFQIAMCSITGIVMLVMTWRWDADTPGAVIASYGIIGMLLLARQRVGEREVGAEVDAVLVLVGDRLVVAVGHAGDADAAVEAPREVHHPAAGVEIGTVVNRVAR